MQSFISFFAIPSYQLGFASLFYIFVLYLALRTFFNRFSAANKVFLPFLLTCLFLSLYVFFLYPHLSVSIMISRFYFGVGLFVFAFSNFKINTVYFIRSLYLFSFVEYFHTKLLGFHPFYIINHFNLANLSAFSRAEFVSGSFRLYGPALNSSISASLIAVLLLLIIRKSIFSQSNPVLNHLHLFDYLALLFVFLLSGSTVGFFVLGIGILFYLSKILLLCFKSFAISKGFIYTLVASAFVFVLFLLSDFGFQLFSTKLSPGYIYYVLEDKLNSISFDNIIDFLFGSSQNLIVSKTSIGGDFVLLNMISICGLVPSSIFFIAFFRLSKVLNLQLSFLVLLISTIHYGSIFNFVGQVFIAILYSTTYEELSSS